MMRHDADLVTGPLYAYLGHFRDPRWLCQGHNDIDASGKQNSSDDLNSFVEQQGAGDAPGASGPYTASSLAGNPL